SRLSRGFAADWARSFLNPIDRSHGRRAWFCPLTCERYALPQGCNRSEISPGHVHAPDHLASAPHFARTALAVCSMQDSRGSAPNIQLAAEEIGRSRTCE